MKSPRTLSPVGCCHRMLAGLAVGTLEQLGWVILPSADLDPKPTRSSHFDKQGRVDGLPVLVMQHGM